MDIDWGKAPEGTTHYSTLSGNFLQLDDDGTWFRWSGVCWYGPYKVSHKSVIPRPTEKPHVMSDDCLAAKIGGVGNQIHNLACTYWNNEYLYQHLSNLACELWGLAKEAPKQTVEWVDGLPPVGEMCQPKPPIWYSDARLRVLCHDEGSAVCRVMDGDKLGSLVQLEPNEIRPIQTPEEKKRNELIDIVGQRGSISDADIADAVLKWMNNDEEN